MKSKISATIKNKFKNGSRYFNVKFLPGLFGHFLVTEYPKSGGTWLSQLISGYFEIPFPVDSFPAIKKSVVHGHYLPSNGMKRTKKIFWLVRDGRDVVVSSYYYYLFENEKNKNNPKDMNYFRKRLGFKDIEDINTNLPMYIEFLFTHKPSSLIRFGFEGSWRSFNKNWIDYKNKFGYIGNIRKLTYESMLENPKEELRGIVEWITGEIADQDRITKIVENFSFRAQSGRDNGVSNNNSLFRKGISGDWKNYFSIEASKIFDFYAGDLLVDLGYEPDRSWVKRDIL